METIIQLENKYYPSLNKMVRKNYWIVQKSLIKKMCFIVMSQTRNRHQGLVKITIQRYACKLMDWDNLCGGFKAIGDALRHANVIKDDNPSIVIKFVPEQFKVAHRKDERVLIRIEDC